MRTGRAPAWTTWPVVARRVSAGPPAGPTCTWMSGRYVSVVGSSATTAAAVTGWASHSVRTSATWSGETTSPPSARARRSWPEDAQASRYWHVVPTKGPGATCT
eukprot:234450-Alexandrium_andersonii.AAC.1